MIDGRVEGYFTPSAAFTISVTTSAPATTLPVTVALATYGGITAFCAVLQAALIAQKPLSSGTWQVTLSTGASGTGKVTIATTAGTYSITWGASADQVALRDLLGFAGNIGTGATATGTLQARGLWMPDCGMKGDIDPAQAPLDDDVTMTVSPTGQVLTRSGSSRYKHTNITWEIVAKNRIWQSEETTTNQSYERFYGDVIRGRKHPWFTPGSKVDAWDHAGRKMGSLGADGAVTGWRLIDPPKPSDLRMAIGTWAGAYKVTWPLLVAESVV